MKLIIYPDVDIWKYVLSGLAGREDILLFPLNRHCSLFQRVLRRTYSNVLLPYWMLIGESLSQAISSLHAGDIILLCEYSALSLVSAISQLSPNGVRCHLWLWNHKEHTPSVIRQLLSIRSKGFIISTYHEQDASFFSLRWLPQFFCIHYSLKGKIVHSEPSIDFFFVGYQKNRYTEIQTIQHSLSRYNCKFVSVCDDKDYIPYTHYMEMAAQSRCIVEILYTGDSVCTLRPLEAISLHRKLLTNNNAIRNYPFYNPQNIFIFGEDNLEDLSAFLKSPFLPLPAEVIDQCDINHWVDSF